MVHGVLGQREARHDDAPSPPSRSDPGAPASSPGSPLAPAPRPATAPSLDPRRPVRPVRPRSRAPAMTTRRPPIQRSPPTRRGKRPQPPPVSSRQSSGDNRAPAPHRAPDPDMPSHRPFPATCHYRSRVVRSGPRPRRRGDFSAPTRAAHTTGTDGAQSASKRTASARNVRSTPKVEQRQSLPGVTLRDTQSDGTGSSQ